MNYDLKEIVERVKASEWWEKPSGHMFSASGYVSGYVSATVELNDHGRGLELECSVYANDALGRGATFDEAFADLEKKILPEKRNLVTEATVTV